MRSIFLSYWSLTEALDWRCRFEPRISTEQAFGELRELCLAGRVPAIGWLTLDHPRGFKPLPNGYRPFLDPPLRPVIEDIPAGEWSDLLPHGDHQLLLKKTRLPVWSGVEISKELLIEAWLPVILQSKKENKPALVKPASPRQTVDQAAYQDRVAEFGKAHGRKPPIQTTKTGLEGDREWAKKNGISRADIGAWRRAALGEQKGGRPKNLLGNSANK
jgi:hypothetical protein